MYKPNNKKAFTLLEVVITATLFFSVITVVTSLFIQMIKIKGGLDARQNLAKESYYILEKLQLMSKNYTIDYEEYWNRTNVGCNSAGDSWSSSGNCTMMTYYGNRNVIGQGVINSDNVLYYCSSASNVFSSPTLPIVVDEVSLFPCHPFGYVPDSSGFIQSYGQYKALFIDVKNDVDDVLGAVFDDDDLDRGDGPDAVVNFTGVQELYLISHDRTHRFFLRRKLVEQGDWNNNGLIGDNDNEKLYTIQILQLKGLDAGSDHDFTSLGAGVYDGNIDTRACDASLGFFCSGSNVGGAYSGYRLPIDSDDGWVNLSPSDITISSWNIIVSPVKDPSLARNSFSNQISPHIYIFLETKLYGKSRKDKIPRAQMGIYSVPLQTVFGLPSL